MTQHDHILAAADALQRFTPANDDGPGGEVAVRFTATPFVWRDPATIPCREWLYGHHLIRRFVSLTVAPGAVGKTSLIIADALALASGQDITGTPVYGAAKRVWLWNLEDPRDELERRIAATMLHYGIAPESIQDRLFVDSGRDQELCLASQDRSGTTIIGPSLKALVNELKARRIDVLIVDPFVSSHSVPENDNGAIDAVAKAWGRVAEQANCAVELVHHLRKLGGTEATAEAARGAGALVAASRSTRVLNKMTEDEARKAGLDTPRRHFRAFDDKNNLSPPADQSDWFTWVSIELANGDNVGVVVPWQWPNALDGVSVADLLAVQKAIDGKDYRSSVLADDWVGNAVAEVLDLDLEDATFKEKVKSLLKIWIGSGALVVHKVKDTTKGKDRPVVRVGEWATSPTSKK